MITASKLMRQASMTAEEYMQKAVGAIDARFGEGYAAKHPDLVGVFMRVACDDFNNVMICMTYRDAVRDLLEGIKQFLDRRDEH